MPLPQKDKEPTVAIVLDDLRRLYDHISANYQSLKNRVLALIAGEVAIVSFIFSGDGFELDKFTSAERIFFFLGVILLGVAFGLLLWIVSTADWQIPLDVGESKKLYQRFNSKLDYMEHIKDDYEGCVVYCLGRMATRAKVYNRTLFILSSAILILLVIKFTR